MNEDGFAGSVENIAHTFVSESRLDDDSPQHGHQVMHERRQPSEQYDDFDDVMIINSNQNLHTDETMDLSNAGRYNRCDGNHHH